MRPMRLRHKLVIDYYIGSLLHAVLKPPTMLAGRLLRRDHDLKRCATVTILKMLGGGSLVIAYPSLLALKRAPQVRRLRIVTTPAVQPFARSLGIFDEIIVIRDGSLASLLLDSLAALRILFRSDAVVDLEVHSRLTTVFSLLTCARNRVGFYTGNSFWRRHLATHLLFCNAASGIYHFYDQIAVLFGGRIPPLEECRSNFHAALGPRPAPGASGALRVALAPCCSDLSRERMLEREEWGVVLERWLSLAPARPAVEFHLLGGGRDRDYLEELGESLRRRFPGSLVSNHGGRLSLADSVRQVADASCLFSIDSALLHFGRLLGVPTVSFWGPTDPPSLLRPWPQNRDEIHYRRLSCSPCVHLAQQAPCGGNNLCMRLAADPARPLEPNPAWLVADRRVRRFFRPSAP